MKVFTLLIILSNLFSFLLGFFLKDKYLIKKANKGNFADRYAANRMFKNKK